VSDFATDDILPAPPAGSAAVIHDREYRVRAFRLAADRILLQGAVRDQKPAGLYLADDPAPLTIHHMQLSVEVAFPSLEITDAIVHFESHPHTTCPTITAHYREMIGLSIARGFTHKVRELFGGPNGCTHTSALLQALAPVAVQCFWSMRAADARASGESGFGLAEPDDEGWRRTIDTCHVWAHDGPHVAAREAGEPIETPLFLTRRLAELGVDPALPPG
jgi:hypothetical protein